MSDSRNIKQFLPATFRNDKVDNFLDTTSETLFTKKDSSKINQFIGKTVGGIYDPLKDNYVSEIRKIREDYQLEPSLVTRDKETAEINNIFAYEDLLNSLKYSGSDINDQSRLFSCNAYSFAPPIDIDMFVNPNDYFWYPEGIPAIPIDAMPENIIGKVSFTGFVNGDKNDVITLTSGNHIKLNDDKVYIVDGVGKFIQLFPFDLDNNTPLLLPFVNNPSAEILEKYPAEYITMERGSYDNNIWSRHNAWYHKDALVIRTQTITFRPDNRRKAQRPIICFKRNIELFNYGVYADFVNYKLESLSNNGLVTDDKIIVSGDNTVYKYNGTGFDSIRTLSHGDMVTVINGEFYKKEFRWDELNNNYLLCQEKNKPTDFIRFNLYDSNTSTTSTLLNDEILYPESTFNGCRIFGYKEDNLYGIYDSVLDMYISYHNQTYDSGDIVYVNYMSNDYTYKIDNVEYKYKSKYYKQFNPEKLPDNNIIKFTIGPNNDVNNDKKTSIYVNGEDSSALVLRAGVQYIFDFSDTTTTYRGWNGRYSGILVKNIYTGSTLIQPTHADNNVNKHNVTFNFDSSSEDRNIYEYTDGINTGTIVVVEDVEEGVNYYNEWRDIGVLKTQLYSKKVIIDPINDGFIELSTYPEDDDFVFKINGIQQPKNLYTFNSKTIKPEIELKKGDFLECQYTTNHKITAPIDDIQEIHPSLSNNTWNQTPTEMSYGDIFQHMLSIINNQDNLVGTALSTNNYRDTLKDISKGDVIIQTETPLSLTMFSLYDDRRMPIDAIDIAEKYYENFKLSLMSQTEAYISTNDITLENVASSFDSIVQEINIGKNKDMPYSTSYMFATYSKYVIVTSDENGYTDVFLDLNNNSNAFYIYTTNGIAVIDVDYEVEYDYSLMTSKIILKTLSNNEILEMRYYEDMEPVFCPATPTKFGITNPHYPEIVLNDTYGSPRYFIKGHDGSLTPCFSSNEQVENNMLHGIDLVLIEFERRVYNNILSQFKQSDISIIDINASKPGKFRNTEYSTDEYNSMLFKYFNNWIYSNDIEYRKNDTYNSNDPFTFNYSSLVDADGIKLQGNWRGIYLYYYDTTTPHKTPWEMLGFNIKPDWWDNEYTNDYSSNNSYLWGDLEEGIIRQGERTNINFKQYLVNNPYRRVGLSNVIPVDENGNLKNPIQAGICSEPEYHNAISDWKFGDISPVEFAWRNTSNFNYTLFKVYFNMYPSNCIVKTWNTEKTFEMYPNNVVDIRTLGIHDYDNYIPGLSQWLFDLLIQNLHNTSTVLTDPYSSLNIQLSHKVGGFIDTSELQLLSESYSPNSDTASAIIPYEDVTTRVYESKEINQFEYSGVVITRVRPFDEFYTYKEGYNYLKDDVVYIEKDKTYYKNISSIRHIDWEFSTFYVIGRVVVFDGHQYECIEDHRADNTNKPDMLTMWKLREFNISEWKVIDGKPAPKNTYFKVSGYSSTMPYFLTIPAKTGSKQKTVTGYSEKSRPLPVKPFKANEKVYSGEYRKTIDNKLVIAKNDIVTDSSGVPDMKYWIVTNEIPYSHVSTISYPVEGEPDIIIPYEYGHIFRTEQELINFLAGYSRYLESVGFKFDEYNSERKLYNDWNLAIKEFLEWSLDNKAENTIIILSPSESAIKFSPLHGVITTIKDIDNGVFNVRTYDGSGLPKELLSVTRNNDVYKLKAELPIYYAKLSVREYEHIISVNNTTIFNDIIYNPLYNLRKDRLLLRVEKSSNWDGKLKADGFIISGNKLLPNLETSVDELRTAIDVDSISTQEVINVLKYHNIGYQNREHLRDIGMTDVAQIKFYQGFVKQKGTNSSYQSILRNNAFGADEQMRIAEEWAFKEAEFGAVSNNQSIEILLRNDDIKNTPQPVVLEYKHVFDDKKPSYVYTDYSDRSKWLMTPTKFYNDNDIFPTEQLGNVKVFETAGYVNWDEVNIRSFGLENVDDIMDGVSGEKNNKTIWICNDSTAHNSWNVYKIKQISTAFNIISINSYGKQDKNSALIVLDTILEDNSVFAIYDGVVDKTFQIRHIRDKCHILLPFEDGFTLLPKTYTPSDLQFSKYYSMRINKYVNTIHSTLEHTIDQFITDTMLPVENGDILYVDDNSFGRWVVVKFNGITWEVIREEEDVINISNFEKSLAYDSSKNNVITTFKYHDPIKGFISGAHLGWIDFKTEYDPVEYNGIEYSNFTKQYLGKLWLDTSKFRYIEYEQGSIEYRIRFWGTLFPGSEINIYEWTRGLIKPNDLPKEEQQKVYDINSYITDKEYDTSLGLERTYYYYWVKNPTNPPVNNKRNISASEIANSIRYPENNVQETCAIISNDCFTIYDYTKSLLERECIIQINYRIADIDSEKHKQWVLVSEAIDNTKLPEFVFTKMIDSLIGYTAPDDNGNMLEVPDPALPEILKYGNSNQPMQSWFKEQKGARKIFLERMNEYLQFINWWDVDLFWERSIEDIPRYSKIFGLVDWYDKDFNAELPIKYIVTDRAALITTPSKNGDYIKVIEKIGRMPSVYEPSWTIYERIAEGDTFKKVGQATAAMKFNNELYEVEKLSEEDAIDFRKVLTVLFETIFIKPYDTEINNIFFALVRFVFNDQRSNSWVFPTTYINIKQSLEMFVQSPVYLQDKDSQLLSYIEEAKPYHTKVRKFDKQYNGMDYGGFLVTDFDKRPYVTSGNRDIIILQEDLIDKITSDGISRTYPLEEIHDQIRSSVYIDGVKIPHTDYTITPDSITFSFIPEKPRNYVKNIVVISPNDNDIMLLNNDLQDRGYMGVNNKKPLEWDKTVRENYIRLVYDRISILPSMNLETLKERFDQTKTQIEPEKAFNDEVFEKYDSEIMKFTESDRITTRFHYVLLSKIVNTSETYIVPDSVKNTVTFNIDLDRDNIRIFIDEQFINKNYYKVTKPNTGGTRIKFNMTLYSGQVIIIRNKENYDNLVKALSNYKNFSIDLFIEKMIGVEWNTKDDKLVYLDDTGNLIVDEDFEEALKRAKHELEYINTDSEFSDNEKETINGGTFMKASERGVPEEYTGFEINECTVISSINTYPIMKEGYDTIEPKEIFNSISFDGDNNTTTFDLIDVNVPVEQILVIVNDDEWVLGKHYNIDEVNNKIVFIKVPPVGTNNIIVTDRIGGFDNYNDRQIDKFNDGHKSGYDGLRSTLEYGEEIREYIVYSDDGKQYFFKCPESKASICNTNIPGDVVEITVQSIEDRSTKGLAAIHGTEYSCVDNKRIIKSTTIEFIYYDIIINNTLKGVYRGLFGTHARDFDINTYEIKIYPLDIENTINMVSIEEPYIGIKNIPNYPKYGHVFYGNSDFGEC